MIPDAQVNGVVFLKILETRLSGEQVDGVVFLKILETRLSGEQVNGVVFLKILETCLSGEQVNGVVFLKILETRLSEEQVNGIVFLKILETHLSGQIYYIITETNYSYSIILNRKKYFTIRQANLCYERNKYTGIRCKVCHVKAFLY